MFTCSWNAHHRSSQPGGETVAVITPKDKDILLAPVDSKVTLQVTLLCQSLLACPNL